MKKWLAAVSALAFASAAAGTAGTAEAAPSCVMLRFSDYTAYPELNSDEALSDLIVEKLLAKGTVDLKESYPLGEETEAMLYDERVRTRGAMEAAMEGNFSLIFPETAEARAEAPCMDVAETGDRISPDVIRRIGEAHGAQYLIQGTLVYLGNSAWTENNIEYGKLALEGIGSLIGSDGLRSAAKHVPGSEERRRGMTVAAKMRVIRADSGEVVWALPVTCTKTQTEVQVGDLSMGNSEANMDLYEKALNAAAEKIVDMLTQEADKGEVFS